MSKLIKTDWATVKNRVAKVNKELFEIIERLSPSEKLPLYLVKYNYGQDLIKNGIFQIPVNSMGGFERLDHSDVAHDLGYNDMNHPVFMVLSGCVETSISLDPRSIPFGVSRPGSIVGLWKALDNKDFSYCLNLPNWCVTAGAKSVFMLPKINENRGHHRLEVEFGKPIRKPKSHAEHFLTFSDLAGASWECELLLFSKAWFDQIHTLLWKAFYNYLLSASWRSSAYFRNNFTWDIAFNQIDTDCGVQPSRHIFDIVKHLIITSMGVFPAFEPASNNQLAPVANIQEAYAEVYRIKYCPVIFAPAYLNGEGNMNAVYFSLQMNTALELAAKNLNKATNIEELYQVYLLLSRYKKALCTGDYLKTPVSQLNDIHFDFFHKSPSDYRGFKAIDQLFEEDGRFKKQHSKYSDLMLPHAASFFSGCVRISNG